MQPAQIYKKVSIVEIAINLLFITLYILKENLEDFDFEKINVRDHSGVIKFILLTLGAYCKRKALISLLKYRENNHLMSFKSHGMHDGAMNFED